MEIITTIAIGALIGTVLTFAFVLMDVLATLWKCRK